MVLKWPKAVAVKTLKIAHPFNSMGKHMEKNRVPTQDALVAT